MRRSTLSLLLLVAAVAVVAAPIASAGPGKRELITGLSGQDEAPKAGDPDGYGAAALDLGRGNRVCFRIDAENIGTAVAGHIHEAAKGKAGPVVVPLFTGNVPSRTRCVRAKRSLVRDILRDPDDYYVNVHTPAFPDGAIRGQLTK